MLTYRPFRGDEQEKTSMFFDASDKPLRQTGLLLPLLAELSPKNKFNQLKLLLNAEECWDNKGMRGILEKEYKGIKRENKQKQGIL